jgi:hypothetical protein
MSHPKHGAHAGNDDDATLGNRGALVDLLDPTPCSVTPDSRRSGRRRSPVAPPSASVRLPARKGEVHEPGWWIGPEGIRVAIDRQRGIAMRSAPMAFTEVLFRHRHPRGDLHPRVPMRRVSEGGSGAAARPVSVEQAKNVVDFPILVPGRLPEGAHLVRCVLPAEDPPDGVHLSYVVDPAGTPSIAAPPIPPRGRGNVSTDLY